MEDLSEADFSLGSFDLADIDLIEDVSEANFSLGSFDDVDFSSDSDTDNDEQIGGRHNYNIQLVKERLIQKFNVYGYDYEVHVDAFDRDIDYKVAVQMLYGILRGW